MADKSCGDCKWFAKEPCASGNLGACFFSYAQRYDIYHESAFSYVAVRSTDRACEYFCRKGGVR